MKLNFLSVLLFTCAIASAQNSPLYHSLPVGKYAVGFKIITLNDSSRVSRPEYNYLGEKYTGDRTKKISIHIWYPARPNTGTRQNTFGDYCYNALLVTTNGAVSDTDKARELTGRRNSFERWFGKKITDNEWQNLTQTPMLGHINASPLPDKFPLLIGELRVLSTSVANEVLASNGYVVAMVKSDEYALNTFAEEALSEIPDMQFAISYLQKHENADVDKTGAFGFSGSGFAQVLLGMYDYRIKAVADIESGIYMNGLYQNFSASNYYDPLKLRVPFLHIFSRDLSKEEKYLADFETKTKLAKRYRLLLNQPHLHHWDSACEGYASCVILQNRGAEQSNIKKTFEIFKNDTSTNLRQGFMMNALGSRFLSEKKYDEAIGIFKLNVQLHPEDPNFYDSLAEAYEAAADKENMKLASHQVLDILNKKTGLSDFEKGLKSSAERRLKVD